MWDIHRGIDHDRIPPPQVTVAFHLLEPDGERRTYWLVLRPGDAEVCMTDPGHETDLRVRTDVRTLARIRMGDADLGGALHSGEARLSGPAHLQRGFPGWLKLSLFAGVPTVADP